MSKLYLLFEAAAGYGLFTQKEGEDIGASLQQVESKIAKFTNFSQMVKLEAFLPFRSAEEALTNINALSEGLLPEFLQEFLSQNLPNISKSKKNSSSKYTLAVGDDKIAGSISEALSIKCDFRSDVSRELLRGIRLHFTSFVQALDKKDVIQSQLGLSHAYSRSKIKFNVNRADNNIIQSICLLDQLDKDINTFAMRIREWYSWHFPELAKIVNDNILFAQIALVIQSKSTLNDEKIPQLEEIVKDRAVAEEIVEAAKTSMGTEISELDMLNVCNFAKRVVSLDKYRKQLHAYMGDKMETVAPNLSALIGDQVAARLISHAGSLTNLAKYPASTVQILGAEKALFRAIKSRGNTPKYGLIFHSTFIGRAGARDKGRISRFLANKCSLAARIDSFSDARTKLYGEKMKEQVEERLEFYQTGKAPKKNIDVMHSASEEVKLEIGDDEMQVEEQKTPKKSKKEEKQKTPKKEEKTPKKDKTPKKEEKTPKKEEKTPKKEGKTPEKSKRKRDSMDVEDDTPSKKSKKDKKKRKSKN